MKKIMAALALLLLAGTVFAFTAFRPWLERRLETALEAKGLQNVAVTIDHLGLKGAALRDVRFGGARPVVLKDIVLDYTPGDLWRKNLREVSVKGVSFEIRKDNDRWAVAGLEGWKSGGGGGRSALAFLPATKEQLARIPFESIRLEESAMNVFAGAGQLFVPLDIAWRKSPVPEASYETGGLAFRRDGFEIAAGKAAFKASLEEGGQWKGLWRLEDIAVKGASLPVPPLHGNGALVIDAARAGIEGTLQSQDLSWQAEFTIRYAPEMPGTSALTITRASLPWKEGRLAIRDVTLPFAGKNPVKLNLHVQHVSIAELMQSLTGNRVSATGAVSGVLPLIIGRDGKITVLKGDLKAEGPGTIAMPPEIIPGGNEQVVLVRQVLEDLHYTVLSIVANTDESGKLSVKMALEGKNPKVYEGRAVKLNVNLTGDVLEFIEKNILFLTSPETLLKPERRYNEEN